jgi:putative ABC transport system permease protein
MSRQLQLFHRLVRIVFPEDFRADYESEMTRTFRAQHREAHAGGTRAIARLWWETMAGIARTAPREHVAQLAQDVRYALRMMRRTPAFTAIAILTLATGIGASTAIFSVVHAVLLRPLPYTDPDRVAMLWNHWTGSGKSGLSNPELFDFRERLRSIDLAAAAGGSVNVVGRGEPERLKATYVTAGYLPVLGVQPRLGRAFRPEEERPGEGRVVLLAHDTWTRLFNGTADAVGQRVTLDRESYTVIGVLPQGFVLPNEFDDIERSAVMLPLTMDTSAPRAERGSHYLRAAARLRPGFTLEQAQAEVDAMTRGWLHEYQGEYDKAYGATLWPARTDIVGDVRPALLVLFGAVCLVLLIACANVANLLLARGQVRAREVAVRRAIGASRARLVRQVLTESLVLAFAAAGAGVVLAHWLTRLMARTASGVPRLDEVALDPVVLVFTAGVAVLTAVVFGCLPALQLAQTDSTPERWRSLSGLRGAGSAAIRQSVRSALVTAQVALALVLLVGAGLLLQSFSKLLGVPAGFRPDRVLTFRVALPIDGFREREPVVRFFDELLARMRDIPGVTAAGAAAGLPLQTGIGDWDFYLPGETPGPHGSDRPADWQVITPGYFEAMGVRLMRGRFVALTDHGRAIPVVVVNETLARTYFSGRDPIGQQIRMSGGERPWMTIIGVSADLRHDSLDTPANAQVFMPHAQFTPFWSDTTVRSVSVSIRTTGEPLAAASTVRARIREIDPNLPISQLMTMDDVVHRSIAPRRLQVLLFATFAAVALVLAVVGTYGVLSYQITERASEFGVRMALGARAGDILRMVIRQGMTPAVAGVLLGLGGAMALTRLLSTLLFDTEPLDPLTFAGTAALLLAAAFAACCVPARRATRVDPSTVLRAE